MSRIRFSDALAAVLLLIVACFCLLGAVVTYMNGTDLRDILTTHGPYLLIPLGGAFIIFLWERRPHVLSRIVTTVLILIAVGSGIAGFWYPFFAIVVLLTLIYGGRSYGR